MSEEFNLSKKIELLRCSCGKLEYANRFHKRDVKEFIRLLKREIEEEFFKDSEILTPIKRIIDKLAGDKLK